MLLIRSALPMHPMQSRLFARWVRLLVELQRRGLNLEPIMIHEGYSLVDVSNKEHFRLRFGQCHV